jgi:WD40 repeat protein
LEGRNSFVNTLAFTPDDRILVSGGNDQAVRLWDMADREAQPIVIEGQSEILSVAISPDGKILAGGGADGAIRLWSMSDPTAPHATLLGHQESVRFLTFSPVAHVLVSGGDDGTIRIWPTLDGLRELGCSLVRRNLSTEEWQAYLGEEPYRETCP